MSSGPPFIDHEKGSLDTDQIRAEAFPLAGLVALVAGVALIPYVFVLLFAGNSAIGILFTVIAQLVLAVGTGIVLMYVIARGIQLAGV